MKRDPLAKYRIFHGESYRLTERRYLTKSEASRLRNIFRKMGRKSRTIHFDKGYLVYVR